MIEFERPETIAMIIMEPVQNAGGSIVPPAGYWDGLREICDRHGILLVSDEVICAFGRIGEWFGAQRLGSQPDMITFAKGLTGAHFSMGGVLMQRQGRRPVPDRQGRLPARDHVRRPPGRLGDRAEGDRDHGARERARQRPRERAAGAASCSRASRTSRSSATSAAWATSSRSRCVKDQATREPLTEEEAGWLLKDVLSDRLFENGMICRLDDRSEPFVQIAPPLVADIGLFEEITEILRDGLTHARRAARGRRPRLAAPCPAQVGSRWPMTALADLELPEIDPSDPALSGERWHEAMRRAADSGEWLARAPLATVVLDREAGEFFLRTKAAIFPGVLLADLFAITDGPLREQVVRNIINVNGADHGRLRKLVNPALAPRAVDRYRPAMREILAELWEPVAERGRCDLVEAITRPYPARVIAAVMGAPGRGRRPPARLVDVDPAAVRPDGARRSRAARDDQRARSPSSTTGSGR